MFPATPLIPYTEERAPGLYDHMRVYAPLVWMMDWAVVCVLQLGLRAGFISPEFLMPSRPAIKPIIFRRNRQLRRARVSCLRRARRCAMKQGCLNPEDYTPRAYAHFGYISRMDKTITPAQFMEHYIRDNNISRVQFYGMDSAHEITRLGAEIIGACLAKLSPSLARFGGSFALSLAAPTDPAPP